MSRRVKQKRMARPFRIVYYATGVSWRDNYRMSGGSSPTLVGARSRVTWWLGRQDYYPRAIIYDNRTGQWIYRLWRKMNESIEIIRNPDYKGE